MLVQVADVVIVVMMATKQTQPMVYHTDVHIILLNQLGPGLWLCSSRTQINGTAVTYCMFTVEGRMFRGVAPNHTLAKQVLLSKSKIKGKEKLYSAHRKPRRKQGGKNCRQMLKPTRRLDLLFTIQRVLKYSINLQVPT